MTVQAKLHCNTVSAPEYNVADPTRVVRLTPVYGDGKENKEWSKWTPAGYVELTITNPAAFDQFEVGADYLVNFEKVVV